MKKLKKLFAVMLSLVMVLAMGITSFAADNVIGNSDDTAQIKVEGVDDDATSVKAYPIIKTTYGSNGDFSGYEVLYTTNPAIVATKNEDNSLEYTLSQEQIAQIRAGLHNDAIDMTNVGNGTYTADAKLGAYLVIVEGSETSTYNAMVVSTNYKNENGANAIDLGKNTATAKKSTKPTLDKNIKNADATTTKHNTVNIGDVINYEVSVANIPEYTGKYPVFNVVDTLSQGLTFNGEDVTVTVNGTTLTKDVDYKFTKEGQKITINFVDKSLTATGKTEYGYTLNSYKGQNMTIAYSATVNENAKLNEVGNQNDATLTYSKDSTVNNNNGTDEKKTHSYTFDIDGSVEGTDSVIPVDVTHILNKIGEEVKKIEVNGEKVDVKAALEGAEFTVYTDEACTVRYQQGGEAYPVVRSTAAGQIELKGLAAGTYYIKETKAPAGYSVNATAVKVEITGLTFNENDELTGWTIKVNNQNVASFVYGTNEGGKTKFVRSDSITNEGTEFVNGYNILNTKITALPSTGGIGTTIFTIVGCGIMIAAAGLFFASRRKENR